MPEISLIGPGSTRARIVVVVEVDVVVEVSTLATVVDGAVSLVSSPSSPVDEDRGDVSGIVVSGLERGGSASGMVVVDGGVGDGAAVVVVVD